MNTNENTGHSYAEGHSGGYTFDPLIREKFEPEPSEIDKLHECIGRMVSLLETYQMITRLERLPQKYQACKTLDETASEVIRLWKEEQLHVKSPGGNRGS